MKLDQKGLEAAGKKVSVMLLGSSINIGSEAVRVAITIYCEAADMVLVPREMFEILTSSSRQLGWQEKSKIRAAIQAAQEAE